MKRKGKERKGKKERKKERKKKAERRGWRVRTWRLRDTEDSLFSSFFFFPSSSPLRVDRDGKWREWDDYHDDDENEEEEEGWEGEKSVVTKREHKEREEKRRERWERELLILDQSINYSINLFYFVSIIPCCLFWNVQVSSSLARRRMNE